MVMLALAKSFIVFIPAPRNSPCSHWSSPLSSPLPLALVGQEQRGHRIHASGDNDINNPTVYNR